MNPVLDDVVAAFGQVAVHPISISIDRSGVVLPEGGHFQGIQRLPEQQIVVITSSSNDKGYFVACDMASDGLSGRARSPVTMAWSPFRHCGGCQAFGNSLVAGLEDDDKMQTSEVQFWDFTRFPVQLIPMTIPRSGAPRVSTAGAVGLTSFGRGTVLAVATWNADTVDFLISEGDPFHGSRFEPRFTWAEDEADKTGWIDDNFGHYQNVNLLTQRDSQLFLIGFHRNDSDEDWMDLYGVNLDAEPSSALTKIAKHHMFCTHGCSFDAGAGIFIESSTVLKVLAVRGDSGDHEDGTEIQVNLFDTR